MIYHWDNEPLSLHAQIHIAPGPDMAAVAPGTLPARSKAPKAPGVAWPGNAPDLSTAATLSATFGSSRGGFFNHTPGW